MTTRIDHLTLAENGPLIKQSDAVFALSIDAVLLASFARVPYGKGRVVDLGCGNAPLSLLLSEKTRKEIVGVEIQSESARLARESVALNRLTHQVTIIESDFRGIARTLGHDSARLVVFNPPYFSLADAGAAKKSAALNDARHETLATLDDYVAESASLLSEGGALACVYRAEHLDRLLSTLARHSFGLKRLRFVYPKTTSASALLVLCEARWRRPSRVVVEPSLAIQNDDGSYTEEVRTVFGITTKQIESEEQRHAA